jgi:hypothetical protein
MRDFKLVADSIENLSLGGLLVGPSDPVLTGEQLFLSFRLPFSGQWIDTDATVSRVIHGRRDEDATRQLGVRFDSLPSDAREAIVGQLRRIPALAPTSRPGRRDVASGMHRFNLGSGWTRSAAGHALVRWWDH